MVELEVERRDLVLEDLWIRCDTLEVGGGKDGRGPPYLETDVLLPEPRLPLVGALLPLRLALGQSTKLLLVQSGLMLLLLQVLGSQTSRSARSARAAMSGMGRSEGRGEADLGHGQ